MYLSAQWGRQHCLFNMGYLTTASAQLDENTVESNMGCSTTGSAQLDENSVESNMGCSTTASAQLDDNTVESNMGYLTTVSAQLDDNTRTLCSRIYGVFDNCERSVRTTTVLCCQILTDPLTDYVYAATFSRRAGRRRHRISNTCIGVNVCERSEVGTTAT
jgi:hypothetical protein